ncbi:NUDIX domain-containing protein [Actinotalea sp. K2]|uniref:NUDIX hydrolase n=1 Tax=Actinotalea sp. K2 TaxID=2939438 RepID=UPI002017B65F|nr:NUDIX domain-containing protein [Actinotalea sp. K2]MCL3859573.1 NUDIX domain-containing protein [Actinotalea sp. K2]
MPIPEFVLRLRAAVGHAPLWLPGASVVVLDDTDRLLLGRRADNGLWAVVSGIVEPGEEPARAITREALEETGVEIEVVALTAVSITEEVRYANGDLAQYLDLCFWGRPVGGTAHVADDESTEVAWFERDHLPADLTRTSTERIARTLAYVAAARGGGRPEAWFAR